MAEICLCGCPKERHRFNTGRCIRCGEVMCPKYSPEGGGLEVTPQVVEPLPPRTGGVIQYNGVPEETLEELKQSFLAAHEPGRMTVLPNLPEPLESFDAWRCYICGLRSYRQAKCCRLMDPVRVEIHSREVTR